MDTITYELDMDKGVLWGIKHRRGQEPQRERLAWGNPYILQLLKAALESGCSPQGLTRSLARVEEMGIHILNLEAAGQVLYAAVERQTDLATHWPHCTSHMDGGGACLCGVSEACTQGREALAQWQALGIEPRTDDPKQGDIVRMPNGAEYLVEAVKPNQVDINGRLHATLYQLNCLQDGALTGARLYYKRGKIPNLARMPRVAVVGRMRRETVWVREDG